MATGGARVAQFCGGGRLSRYSITIVVEIMGISDLGLYNPPELLQLEHVSRCERPSRGGLERTELGGEGSVNREGLRGLGRPGVEDVQPVRAPLWVD